MFKSVQPFLLGVFLILPVFFACQSTPADNQRFVPTVDPNPMVHIQDANIRNILAKSFQRMGGLERWQNKTGLHFKKYFALYDATGKTEKEANQDHDYLYAPQASIQITWMENGKKHQIRNTNEATTKTVDGAIDKTAKASSLTNTVASSTFVMDIPFKLLDQGVVMQYEGVDTLDDQQVVEVIRASYDPEQFEHHTTPDIWWYYFDQKDFRLCGYKVKHLDHYSYVRNESYEEVDGFLFTKTRKSYRVDSSGKRLYLRADYAYSDFVVDIEN